MARQHKLVSARMVQHEERSPIKSLAVLFAAACLLASGCASRPPPPTVERVDLQRFMGDWYVHGGIFTPFEKGSHDAIETYRLDDKGRIPTTFRLRKGSHDAPISTYESIAFVHNTNTFAEWRIQFFWPLRFPYLILHLADDYSSTAVGTPDRDYLWIMARRPDFPEADYAAIAAKMGELGFDTNRFVRVPHRLDPR